MAKTCRTCKGVVPMWRCYKNSMYVSPNEIRECHKPRETPLLVDELAEALDGILSALTGAWFSYTLLPGAIEDAEVEARKLTNRAEQAFRRYQKEVGDVEMS